MQEQPGIRSVTGPATWCSLRNALHTFCASIRESDFPPRQIAEPSISSLLYLHNTNARCYLDHFCLGGKSALWHRPFNWVPTLFFSFSFPFSFSFFLSLSFLFPSLPLFFCSFFFFLCFLPLSPFFTSHFSSPLAIGSPRY